MEIKTIKKKRKLLPGLDMTQEELMARVRKAEEGPFYTLEEFKQKIQEWKAFPSWEEVQQKRDARNSRYGFDPATGCGTLSTEQLTEMIREAEEGPFYTLEEGKQMIQQWREQRQNR